MENRNFTAESNQNVADSLVASVNHSQFVSVTSVTAYNKGTLKDMSAEDKEWINDIAPRTRKRATFTFLGTKNYEKAVRKAEIEAKQATAEGGKVEVTFTVQAASGRRPYKDSKVIDENLPEKWEENGHRFYVKVCGDCISHREKVYFITENGIERVATAEETARLDRLEKKPYSQKQAKAGITNAEEQITFQAYDIDHIFVVKADKQVFEHAETIRDKDMEIILNQAV